MPNPAGPTPSPLLGQDPGSALLSILRCAACFVCMWFARILRRARDRPRRDPRPTGRARSPDVRAANIIYLRCALLITCNGASVPFFFHYLLFVIPVIVGTSSPFFSPPLSLSFLGLDALKEITEVRIWDLFQPRSNYLATGPIE